MPKTRLSALLIPRRAIEREERERANALAQAKLRCISLDRSTKYERIHAEMADCHERLQNAEDAGAFNRNLKELAILLRLKWKEEAHLESKIVCDL